MLRTFTAIALSSLIAAPAFAGGIAEPIIEPEVIVEDTSSSAAGIVVPLLLILLLAAAVSGSDDDVEILE